MQTGRPRLQGRLPCAAGAVHCCCCWCHRCCWSCPPCHSCTPPNPRSQRGRLHLRAGAWWGPWAATVCAVGWALPATVPLPLSLLPPVSQTSPCPSPPVCRCRTWMRSRAPSPTWRPAPAPCPAPCCWPAPSRRTWTDAACSASAADLDWLRAAKCCVDCTTAPMALLLGPPALPTCSAGVRLQNC